MPQTIYTPRAACRWAHLINASEYEGKYSYSVELLLNNDDKTHQAFLNTLEQEFVASHGTKKSRADKGEPWRPDKTESGITVVKFKANRFDNPDGTFSRGPRIVDAKRATWDGRDIGNGSEIIIGFTTYAWDAKQGCGLTLNPRAVQVLKFVPREDMGDAAADGFEEQDGFSVNDADDFEDEFA